MRAYLHRIAGEFANVNVYTAWAGFRELGYELLNFEGLEGVDSLVLDDESVVVGGIPAVHRALERMGLPVPHMPAIPAGLEGLAGRRLWTAPMAEVRCGIEAGGDPVFIKPLPGEHKWFDGHVVSAFRDLARTAALPDDLAVQCSEVVDFTAEYRCFVHWGEIVGCKHYRGDFRLCPDPAVAERAVQLFRGAPVAYSLDVGLTSAGRTLLVEANDAYALGSYGLSPIRYARMLGDRWAELTASVHDHAPLPGPSPRRRR